MLDALVGGTLFAKPVERMTKANRPFVTAKLRVPTREDSIFVSVVAFKADVVTALLALDAGDSVALSGELKVSTYTDRSGQAQPSIEITAQAGIRHHVTAAPPSGPRMRSCAPSHRRAAC